MVSMQKFPINHARLYNFASNTEFAKMSRLVRIASLLYQLNIMLRRIVIQFSTYVSSNK